MEVNGFVIVPPLSPWDDPQKVIPTMCYNSFGRTATEAWVRKIGVSLDHADSSIIIQRWHDRGYRLKVAKLVIEWDGE